MKGIFMLKPKNNFKKVKKLSLGIMSVSLLISPFYPYSTFLTDYYTIKAKALSQNVNTDRNTKVKTKAEKEIELDKEVTRIAAKFSHLKNDVDKVMAVHDYILDNVTYDNNYIVGYAYGAIIEKRAVCQGYASAFQKILSKLGIEGRTVGGTSKGVSHKWNRVKLDDGWYFVDTTWDDNDNINYPLKNYAYFLINSEILNRDHSGWAKYQSETDGSKYIYYAYKKKGLFAENKNELTNIIKKQLDSTNEPNLYLGALVPKSLGDNAVRDTIKSLTNNDTIINEVNTLRGDLGNYTFYYYEVSHVNSKNNKTISLSSVTTNDKSETTHKIKIKFDQDIEDLSIDNISIDKVNKKSLKKINNKEYELTITDILVENGKSIDISINKRGYNILNNNKKITIHVVKEDTPNATFTATGEKKGYLSNVESNMKYTTGDGIWHDINSNEKVEINNIIYKTPIYVVRKAQSDKKVDSSYQVISPLHQDSPDNVKSLPCDENKSNGKLINVNSDMEYKKESETEYKICTENEVTNLSSGKYNVRYKANKYKLSSPPYTITIDTKKKEDNLNPKGNDENNLKPNDKKDLNKDNPSDKNDKKDLGKDNPNGKNDKKDLDKDNPNGKNDKKDIKKHYGGSSGYAYGSYGSSGYGYSSSRYNYISSSPYMSTSTTKTYLKPFKKADGTIAKKEWISHDNNWLYAKENGSIAQNEWICDKNNWYYAKDNGAIAQNEWVYDKNNWYYAKENGAISQNEWVFNNNSWFYAKDNGAIAQNEWSYVNNSWFYSKAGGFIAQNEWIYVNGNWYYAKENGAISQKETLKINGKNYSFNSNGALIG